METLDLLTKATAAVIGSLWRFTFQSVAVETGKKEAASEDRSASGSDRPAQLVIPQSS